MELGLTPSQTIGPFFHSGLEWMPSAAGPGARGEPIRLSVRVLDGDGAPVSDAMIESWQADAEGRYHHPEDPRGAEADPDFSGFARVPTNDAGECEIETVRPGRVPGPGGPLQAPHVNVTIFARGVLKPLVTRAYFEGEPSNAEDPVLARVPEHRRDTLMARPDPERHGVWRFEVRLCDGSGRETVFFDV